MRPVVLFVLDILGTFRHEDLCYECLHLAFVFTGQYMLLFFSESVFYSPDESIIILLSNLPGMTPLSSKRLFTFMVNDNCGCVCVVKPRIQR